MKPIRGTPNQGLGGATLGFFFGFAAVALFGPTAAKFKEAMGLSPVLVGLLVAMPSLSGSLLRIPFSAWVDTTGGRKPFLILLILSIIGMSGLLWVTHSFYPDRMTSNLFPLLLVLGLLCGCGIATFSVGISQVSYWFPQAKQGRALGTYAGLGNLAPGLFSFLLPLVLRSQGLAGAYLAWLVFLVVGTGLYALLARTAWYFQLIHAGVSAEEARAGAQEQGQELFPAGNLMDSLRVSAANWRTWCLVAVYFATFGGFIALTAWYPTYWKEFFGLAPVAAGALTAMYSVLTSLIRVGGGVVADKVGGENTAFASLLTMLIGAIIVATSHQIAPAVVGSVLLALGMGVANAAVFKLVPREVPEAVGGAAGWVGGLGAFGGFAIPPILGVFVRGFGVSGYATGFSMFALLALIAGAAVGAVRWHALAASHVAPASASVSETDPDLP